MEAVGSLTNFGIALLIGVLVGLEREKRQAVEEDRQIGGIRTFILFAEAGAVAAWLAARLDNAWIFVCVGLVVGGAVVAGYVAHVRKRPASAGLTTEIAAVIVYLLGGTAVFGYPEIAVPLGIVTSAVLAFKQPLHGVVDKIGLDDIYAALKLLIASFIVLPLLPDRPIDPWQALNPYSMWQLVILISGLSLVGYVAGRWVGDQHGSALTGILGGLVSSTAVTLSFSRTSRDSKSAGLVEALATGVVLAWTVMFGRMMVEIAVVYPPLLSAVAVPLVMMVGAAAVVAALFYRQSSAAARRTERNVPLSNPFSIGAAIRFALLFAAVLLVVKIAREMLPQESLYVVAALAGLTDVDAITLSMAALARDGGDHALAATAIVVAAWSNTLVKCGLVVFLGSPALKRRVLLAAGAILAAGAVGLLADVGVQLAAAVSIG